ncbi:hypothetical protein R70006_04977 [Paraburkholderia domus]|uniref:hypothetical protein n=1 Tax=Paraburkholderia domus TaxID=2793075 RepID=UPI001913A5B2|nr:hypothetical protein [Paraburkholderia domus]MBK5051787.1 hypothetical protein [Burkholderia sp. R-70006]CAE6793874.1 hypothetical protein R70006_04977 [Paraburkholderia domus]
MSDPTNDSLRFVVPLDEGREDDQALLGIFKDVPNGLIGSVARVLLMRSLPGSIGDLDGLLIEAMRDQASRKRLRGRPAGRRTAPALPAVPAPVAAPRATGEDKGAGNDVQTARAAPVVAPPAPEVAQAPKRPPQEVQESRADGGESVPPQVPYEPAAEATDSVLKSMRGLVAWTN